ncbi:endolytic transglycosylase MltG [Nonomuraea sp. NPDC049152]|uniref:endolytic transglycosylase MltG n=1 Tax=Nonomuraea sp. NPDC049152 TaxID=3154350 RepID=UPI0033C0AAEB
MSGPEDEGPGSTPGYSLDDTAPLPVAELPSAEGPGGDDDGESLAEVIPFARPAEGEGESGGEGPDLPAAGRVIPLVAEDELVFRGRDGRDSRDSRDGRDKALRKAGVLAGGAAASVLALGAAGFVVLKPYVMPDDFDGSGAGSVTVRINPGASAGDIGALLADAGVVASARSFSNIAKERSKAASLYPGSYLLRKGMAAGAALDLLLAPSSRVVKRVTLPDGMRLAEALPHLAKQSGIPLKDFQNAPVPTLGLPAYAPGLEGFLYPATYEVEPGTTAADLLRRMVTRFKQEAESIALESRAAAVKLTPLEAVTVASLVQAEGGRDGDYPKIARVIYNRLRGGTPLQLDATVTYALNRRTLKVSHKDTKVRSRYNTYRHKGLPPGPIANPGEKALLAALNPAKGHWNWFVTTNPEHRITKFTDKESEFVRYREELNDYLGTH